MGNLNVKILHCNTKPSLKTSISHRLTFYYLIVKNRNSQLTNSTDYNLIACGRSKCPIVQNRVIDLSKKIFRLRLFLL